MSTRLADQCTSGSVVVTSWCQNVPHTQGKGRLQPGICSWMRPQRDARLSPRPHSCNHERHTYPVQSGSTQRRKVHNQNFPATLNVFRRRPFRMLMPKSETAVPGRTEATIQGLLWRRARPHGNTFQPRPEPVRRQRQPRLLYNNLPQLLNEQGKWRTYFTSSSFLVMTDPTDAKAAEAFCPAWDKVSDVFLYLC